MSAEDMEPHEVLKRIEEIMKVQPIMKSTWALQRAAVRGEISGYFAYHKAVNEYRRQDKWMQEMEEEERIEKESTSEMELP